MIIVIDAGRAPTKSGGGRRLTMDISLTWSAPDAHGRERQLTFVLSARLGRPKWYIKGPPGLPREPISPTEADWRSLLAHAQAQYDRGFLNRIQLDRIHRSAPPAR